MFLHMIFSELALACRAWLTYQETEPEVQHIDVNDYRQPIDSDYNGVFLVTVSGLAVLSTEGTM